MAAANNALSPCRTVGTAPAIHRSANKEGYVKPTLFLHTQLTSFCLPPPPFLIFRSELPVLVYLLLKWPILLSSPNLLTPPFFLSLFHFYLWLLDTKGSCGKQFCLFVCCVCVCAQAGGNVPWLVLAYVKAVENFHFFISLSSSLSISMPLLHLFQWAAPFSCCVLFSHVSLSWQIYSF